MASESVLEFTDANFDAEVLTSDKPVLVDFWASWCNPCLMLAPTIDALADDYKGRIKVGKVDVDANPGLADKFSIRSIPTVMLFRGGEQAKSWQGGNISKAVFAEELDKVTA